MKDKKACIFYLLMMFILLNFGIQIRKLSYLKEFKEINNPIFSIFHINNTGSAFGLFQYKTGFLAILGIISIFLISYFVYKSISFDKNKLALLSLTLFASGVIGNVIERIQFSYVIDYIKLNFIDFPIFNCFDIMICTGVFLYFLSTIIELIRSKKAKQ